MNSLTLGSLFAGVGGFDLGFERAGFETVWQCEIDKAAQGVLRLRFPHAKLHSDVRQVGAHNLEPVDVLTFGSPCQDLSVAGKRAGLAGDRSGLFHEAARVIRELRERYGKPDFAIWENVPGAFSSNGGADFAAVVQTMVDLGARDVCWRVLDSQNFGVAQRRRRVFLVADFGGERAEQVLFEPESLRGNIAPSRKARKGSAGNVAGGSGGGGGAGVMWSAGVSANAERYVDQAGALITHRSQLGGWIGPAAFASLQGGRSMPVTKATHQYTEEGSPPLIKSRPNCVGTSEMPATVRRLTPVECERLQGFPDGWTAEGIDASGKVKAQADGPRYKQMGNAVTVSVAAWLAERLRAATMARQEDM